MESDPRVPSPKVTRTTDCSFNDPSEISWIAHKSLLCVVSARIYIYTCCQQSLKGLYNELTPDVEAQVAAIEQEKARLNQSLDYVREELEKVDVSAELTENLEATRAALERAKAQVRVYVCADRILRGGPPRATMTKNHPFRL